MCLSRSSCGIRASVSGPMQPSPCPACTSAWKLNGSNTRSACPPIRSCRTGSAICSSEKTNTRPVRHCPPKTYSRFFGEHLWAAFAARSADCSTALSGQAPKPRSSAPKGPGLTAKERIERSSPQPRCKPSSDTVREIKYQILQLKRPVGRPPSLTESRTKGREGKRQASDMMSDSDFSGGAGMKRRREGAVSHLRPLSRD
jgi:hypothetical protein